MTPRGPGRAGELFFSLHSHPMTSPKPDRASQKPGRARGQQGFGSLTVVVLCAACFFAGRFITLPGQLPPAAGSGVSAGQNPAANAALCCWLALRIHVCGVQSEECKPGSLSHLVCSPQW